MSTSKTLAFLIVAGAVGGGFYLGSLKNHGPATSPAGTQDVDQAVTQGPAGPTGGPVRRPDVVYERSKPVLRCQILGQLNYHQGKPTKYLVQMTRLYHESFYVGGQRGVTSGREVVQDLGQVEIPIGKIHNFTYILDEIQAHKPAPTATPEDQQE